MPVYLLIYLVKFSSQGPGSENWSRRELQDSCIMQSKLKRPSAITSFLYITVGLTLPRLEGAFDIFNHYCC